MPDVHPAEVISHIDDQTKVIATNIEDGAIVTQETR
jgi:hypothetical protein